MARPRSPTRRLKQVMDASSCPIYVLDPRRHVVYCNPACSAWLGVPVEEIVDRRCDYHDGDVSTDRLSAALCPLPAAFEGEPASVALVSPSGPDRGAARRAQCVPLRMDTDWAVMVVVGQRQREPESTTASSDPLHDRLRALVHENRGRFRLSRLAGTSAVMLRVREQIRVAIEAHSNAVVIGPPGSGREHVARTIHCADQPREAPPLMPLDCRVLDAELLQATILAFLERCREDGASERATILLLEADQMPPAAQAELLAFTRVPTFRCRTLATARESLIQRAADEHFDVELASVLSPLAIELPPLARRREDIPLLAQQFVERFNAQGGRQLSGLADETIDQLVALPWDGNTDELYEVLEDACRQARRSWIMPEDLPERVRLLESAAAFPAPEPETVDMDQFLADVERELIVRALRQSGGNKAQAARLLGIHRPRLLRRLAFFGLDGAARQDAG